MSYKKTKIVSEDHYLELLPREVKPKWRTQLVRDKPRGMTRLPVVYLSAWPHGTAWHAVARICVGVFIWAIVPDGRLALFAGYRSGYVPNGAIRCLNEFDYVALQTLGVLEGGAARKRRVAARAQEYEANFVNALRDKCREFGFAPPRSAIKKAAAQGRREARRVPT